MPGTPKRIAGPAYLAAAAADIYTPPAATIYTMIRHIHIANKTGTAATATLYVGATGGSAAGTELFGTKSVAANDTFDFYTALRMDSTDFLTGLSGTANALVITVEGDQSVV